MRRICLHSVILLCFCSIFTAQTRPHGPFGRYTGPNSLGNYRHDRNISMKSFLSTFGAKPAGRDTYCFADKEHGLYLYAQKGDDRSGLVEVVTLSSFPNCMHMPVIDATIDPNVWKTPEGIGIGSTKEDVLHAYHQPVFSEKIGKDPWQAVEIVGIRDSEKSKVYVGDWTYLYSCLLDEKHGCDDPRVTRMGFSRGKLIWIAISDSE